MTTSENAHAYTAQHGALGDEERQIEATLAVAYEQRTANLIALFQKPGVTVTALDGSTYGWSLTRLQVGELLEQIAERLGIPVE